LNANVSENPLDRGVETSVDGGTTHSNTFTTLVIFSEVMDERFLPFSFLHSTDARNCRIAV